MKFLVESYSDNICDFLKMTYKAAKKLKSGQNIKVKMMDKLMNGSEELLGILDGYKGTATVKESVEDIIYNNVWDCLMYCVKNDNLKSIEDNFRLDNEYMETVLKHLEDDLTFLKSMSASLDVSRYKDRFRQVLMDTTTYLVLILASMEREDITNGTS